MLLDQHDTASVLIEREGRFLLIRRGKPPERGFWALPGGHVDPGETVHEAAVRECREEVGEAAVEQQPFLAFAHDVQVGHRHRAHFFRATLLGEPRAGSDASDVRWFSIDEMAAAELAHYTKRVINWLLFGEISKEGSSKARPPAEGRRGSR